MNIEVVRVVDFFPKYSIPLRISLCALKLLKKNYFLPAGLDGIACKQASAILFQDHLH